ncbi:MAG: hypothetical protein ACTHOI_03490 [Sphingomicrobium sp.]
MRATWMLAPLLLCASPALAQDAPPQLPPEITDPAAIQRLTVQMQALSHAFLDMRIGGVQAALEGREATPREERTTVGDLARRRDPDFDRHLQQQLASVGPQIQHSVKAINRALPEMMKSVEDARRSIDRALANMPDPDYPRR